MVNALFSVMVLMRASLETSGFARKNVDSGFDPEIMPSIIGATNRCAGVFSL